MSERLMHYERAALHIYIFLERNPLFHVQSTQIWYTNAIKVSKEQSH